MITPPLTAGEVTGCMKGAERAICLLRLNLSADGERRLRLDADVYADPALARAIGVDIDRPPGPNITAAPDAAAFERSNGSFADAEAVRASLALRRAGADPEKSLGPILALDRPGDYGSTAVIWLHWMVGVAHDGGPGAGAIDPALAAAAAAHLERLLTGDPGSVIIEDYERDLVRWGDMATAERLERLRHGQSHARPQAVELDRIAGLITLDRLQEAADALEPASWNSQPFDIFAFEAAQDRLAIAARAFETGQRELALRIVRRLVADDRRPSDRADTMRLLIDEETRLLVELATAAEAEQWLAGLEDEGRPPASSAKERDAVVAATAAFYGWRALGQADRAHRIVEAWLKYPAHGSNDYFFQPKAAVADMLAAEGRHWEAWTRMPDAQALLRLDVMHGRGLDNLATWLADAPDGKGRLKALWGCAVHTSAAVAPAIRGGCLARVEGVATTAALRLEAAKVIFNALAANRNAADQSYTPPAMDAAGRLLAAALTLDPSLAGAQIPADDVRYAALADLRSADGGSVR